MQDKVIGVVFVILALLAMREVVDSGVLGRMFSDPSPVSEMTRSGAGIAVKNARLLHAEEWMSSYPAERKDFLNKIIFLESELNDPNAKNDRIKLLVETLDMARAGLAERRPGSTSEKVETKSKHRAEDETFGEMVGEPLFE